MYDTKECFKKYKNEGFFIIQNFLEKKLVLKIIKEISDAKNVEKYFDKKKRLRRIEKLYNKGKHLKSVNIMLKDLLKKIFNKQFCIFKDKFNSKPPKGEGFFSHYDGIFYFKNNKNELKKGWYEYSNYFVNVLIALDNSNKTNGTIQIAKKHKGGFNELIKNTNNDGTPNLKKKIEKSIKFFTIKLKIGDIVIFSNICPHRSDKNRSNKPRRNLYYTYIKDSNFSKYQYKKYFTDKKNSKNKNFKTLEGKI